MLSLNLIFSYLINLSDLLKWSLSEIDMVGDIVSNFWNGKHNGNEVWMMSSHKNVFKSSIDLKSINKNNQKL